ncbi:MAG: hypothetical protein ACF8AM_05220, partial [Rhodopirellula sp. JB055]|uniref:hypothetical protein n=1 Tax=Rhodopirellula sp. JB055 TaxID=3342846 RepID=UPI00370BFA4E
MLANEIFIGLVVSPAADLSSVGDNAAAGDHNLHAIFEYARGANRSQDMRCPCLASFGTRCFMTTNFSQTAAYIWS